MKRTHPLFITLLTLIFTFGCENAENITSSNSDYSSSEGSGGTDGDRTRSIDTDGDGSSAPPAEPALGEEEFSGDVSDDDGLSSDDDLLVEEGEEPEPPRDRPQSGQLTAGDWDDNLNYEHYRDYINDFGANPFIQTQGFDFAFQEKHFNSQANAVDVVFVLDTTGSMGDELEYLKVEVEDIITNVALEYNDLSIRTGAVLYRDQGDRYVTKTIDFQSSVNDFKDELAPEYTGGGGDYPEAVHEGLKGALDMQFRPEAIKLVFLLADAPTHDDEHMALLQQVLRAQEEGVTIYPIAASGTDPMAEFLFRVAAQQTTGRYVFLTDDSGIGNSHAEPTIPCYFVRHLSRLLSDIMIYELEGDYRRPEDLEIIRAAGDPDDEGRCIINEEEFFVTC